jgi:hypothetical protein
MDFDEPMRAPRVDLESKRARVEKVASRVPDVQQVVNELQIKNRKARSMQ